jgi:hypothetical protein
MDITSQIADHVVAVSNKRKALAEKLRIDSPNMALKMQGTDLNGMKVCGVDGGLLKKEFHGMTLVVRRAVGVCFSFEGGLVSAQYTPSKNPEPDSFIITPDFSSEDANILINLKRVELEIKTALDCVKKFAPNIIVLDGSIVLHPSSIAKRESASYETYGQVNALLRELYTYCADNDILLVGACEDSRGKKFCNVLKSQLLAGKPEARVLDLVNDTTFLYDFLNVGERTSHFSYSASEDLPGLSDLGDWRRRVYGMYIKPAKYDRPLRLDFLASNPKLQADKISAIVNALSNQSRTYAYPSVLIEADARAKLTERDMIALNHALKEKLGMDPTVFDLRREQRPI